MDAKRITTSRKTFVRLTPEQHAACENLAALRTCNVSDVIREAVASYLRTPEARRSAAVRA